MDFDNLDFENAEDEELFQHGGSLIGKCVCLALKSLSTVFHVFYVSWMYVSFFWHLFSYFQCMGLIGTCSHIFNAWAYLIFVIFFTLALFEA